MKRIVSLIALLCAGIVSFAQITASADTTICAGTPAQLNVTGGTTYTWTPSTGLSSTTSATPTASPATTTTYIVSSPVNTNNIVINGDFSQGNTGFTSGYGYEFPTNVIGSGSYFVGGNAQHWNQGMSALCNDHSGTADSNMLIANGATTAGTPVWCETLPVLPNVNYTLDGWIQELHQQNYPYFQWTVNGVNIGNATQAIFFQCVWTQVTKTWNSGVNTSATFCIVNPTTQGNGNDFAIDDISITASGTISDTVVVNVTGAPFVDLGEDTAICPGQTVMFDAANAGATYLWSNNSTGQTLTVSATGTYTVTVTNAAHCTASDAVDVGAFLLALNPSAVNTTCGLDNGQASVTVGNGTSPYTYLWSNTLTTATIANLAGGTYSVTVDDAAGCSATASAVVNTSGAGNVAITADQLQICASDTSHICAPQGYTSYLWNTGATASCISTSLAGNYYVTVTDNANCTSTSNHLAVGVYPSPPVSVSVNGDTLSAFNAVGYQWYFNNNEILGATGSVYIATQTGNYTVQVTDTNGCTSISNQLPIATGINDLYNDVTLEVYPNPNKNGNWHLVAGAALVGKQLEVIDVTGRTVYQTQLTRTNEQLNLTVPAGVYLLRISSGGKYYLKKLVKQ